MRQIDLMSSIRRFVAPLSHKIRLTVSRGVVKLVNDSLKCQALQVELLKDEIHDEVERFQEYGFTSVPLEGAEVLFLSVGGNRSAGVVACVTDRRYRPKDLNEGDVCLYLQMANGERVYLDKANDLVHLGAKSASAFVARIGDTVGAASGMATWMSQVATAVNGLVPGAVAPPTPADFGTITSGASKVKAT